MSGPVKTLWLRMLEDGGYSTVAELSRGIGVQHRTVGNLLTSLADKGYCQRFRNPDRKNGVGYGVTGTCRVPQGVTLAEIAKAQAVQPVGEEA